MDVLLDLTPLETISRFRGIGYYVSSLARAIDALEPGERRNLDIKALTAFDGDSPVGDLTWQGTPGKLPYGDGRFMDWIWARRSSLVGTLHRHRPGLFHATQNIGTPRGSLVPRVITCHDLILLALSKQYLSQSDTYRSLYAAVEYSRFRSARRIIAISHYTADDLMRLLRIPARVIDVIPHGVHRDRFRPPRDDAEAAAWQAIRKKLGVDQRPYFLFLGAADSRKGAPALIKAFARANLPGVDLVFAGRLSLPELTEINEARRAMPDGDWTVRRLGFVEDEALPALLNGALALAYPSRYEGFGLPVVEAMAAACPVITTNATSLAEVAGGAAITLPPDDIEALARALREVANEPSLRDELRGKGLERAAQFSWKTSAMLTCETYARALG